MRVAIILLAGLAAISAEPIGRGPQRIVGGHPAALGQYPFSASLLRTYDTVQHFYYCGGAIINNRSFLTAAHCFIGSIASQWRMRVGSVFATTGGTVLIGGQLFTNPTFNANTFNSDIGLIRSTTNMVFSPNVQAAPIPSSTYNIAANQPVWAIGWGSTFYGGPNSEMLQQVQVWTVNQATCRARYAELGLGVSINDNMLCAGWLDVGGRGQCYGDSGSPLVHNGVIVGVYSFGWQCALPRQPAVNTRVSTYMNWIVANQ